MFKPLVNPPNAGLYDHVTPVLLDPLTEAVNVWFCDGCNETEFGVSNTETGAAAVRLNGAEYDPPALVEVTVKVKMPGAVGVPAITPVEDARESPAGRLPLETLQAIGAVPVAANVCE